MTGNGTFFTAVAATAIGVSSEYISRLCRQGKLKARRFAGQWLISLTSLEDFLSHRTGVRGSRQMPRLSRQHAPASRSPIHTGSTSPQRTCVHMQ
ncbi:helix-turn-helix domain-containing protein [Candidatus Kaiserbacteria bacterium]|nr:helix-turn-helix domain-containing protein [Candidatus Kaiserbacteria bacterium]